MRFELTDTQRDIQKAAREFAEKEFDLDLALELEKEGRFPKSIFEKACQLGFIGIDYPEEYGGQSFGLFENVLVIEEFCRKDSGVGISISFADMAPGVIIRHGDQNQKKKFLLPITQGKAISTVALVDSRNIEDQGPITTKADEYPNGYVISGGKSFVVNGSIATTFLVFSEMTNNSNPIVLIVERDQEGVNILGVKRMMGMKISSIYEIAFDQVKVPKDHVIQWGNKGVDPITTYRYVHRIKTSAQALGIAEGAFDQAMKHAKQREQFGKKIIQF